MATLDNVQAIVNKWKDMCEPNMPTFHVFTEAMVLNISIATGTLTRSVRLLEDGCKFIYEGPYVDSISVYHSDTLNFTNLSVLSREPKPAQYASTLSRIIPFFQYTTEPRLDLTTQMRV
jgi:hypothetical protein